MKRQLLLHRLRVGPHRAGRTAERSDTLLLKGYGKADLEWDVPMPADAMFEINYLAPRFPRDSARALVKLDPFVFQPGEAQAYNTSGFWLLGLVVERASGMKYEDYLAKKQNSEPLRVQRSMYCNTQANVTRRAHGYGMQGPGLIHRTRSTTPGSLRPARSAPRRATSSPGSRPCTAARCSRPRRTPR